MQLKLLVFFLLMTCSSQSHSQFYKRSQLDSLQFVLNEQKGEERIKTLLNLSEAYQNFQLDTAQLFVNMARNESLSGRFGWGICKSYFIESDLHILLKLKSIEEVKRIKEHCAKWFEDNNYLNDALEVQIDRNLDVMYNEGRLKAYENAKTLLKRAQILKDPWLLSLAWHGIVKMIPRKHIIDEHVSCADSSLFYKHQVKDSIGLIFVTYDELFQKTAGRVSNADIIKLEEIAARWQNPTLWLYIQKLRCFPFAQHGKLDTVKHYVNNITDLEITVGNDNTRWIAKELLMSITHNTRNERHLANNYLLKAIVGAKNRGNLGKVMEYLYRIGRNDIELKQYENAISNFLEALNISIKLQDDYMKNSINRNLADLYVLTGEEEKAEQLYLEVIDWSIQNSEDAFVRIMLGNAYTKFAEFLQAKKQYDKARIYYNESANILSYSRLRLIAPKTGLLSMFLDMNNLESADSIHQDILETITPQYFYSHEKIYLEEGRLYMALQNYSKAIESLNSFFEFGNVNDVTEDKRDANLLLYEAYKSLGQSGEALAAFEAYKAIQDSLDAGNEKENVQKIQSDYELSLKESEIERLEQKQEISDLKLTQQESSLELRNLYIAMLILIMIAIGILGYLIVRRLQLKRAAEKEEIKKALEIEHLKIQQKAEIAEVKNGLYANVSHEFKTPLTLIRVPLQRLKQKASAEEQVTYDSMLRNTDHLLGMLDEMLGISRLKTDQLQLQMSDFNLATLLSQIKLNFAPLFEERNIQFDWDITLNQDHFYGDEHKLNIVISNLLSNAFNNTHENGWVSCSIDLSQSLNIIVSNLGDAIEENDLLHIFERHYRANSNKYKGEGIGLALSKQIVELHHGTIEAANQPSTVVFSVNIPAKEHIETLVSSLNGKPNGQNTNKKTSGETLPHVLVVEDNLEMQSLLQTTLNAHFQLSFANNGEIGEQMAVELQPDLVLSDVMMPEKDGFELLQSLKENFNSSHIPVILLTARGDSKSRITGLNHDADDYVSKPFDAEALIARIHNLLRQRQHLHKLFSENPLLYSKDIKCTPLDADFVDRARKILEKFSSDGDFAVEEFCRELALNRTSVNTKIRALTNQSVAKYIKNFRLEKAVKLLLETNAGISAICTDSGFNSIQVFNKAFKKKYNMTPSVYRSEFRQ